MVKGMPYISANNDTIKLKYRPPDLFSYLVLNDKETKKIEKTIIPAITRSQRKKYSKSNILATLNFYPLIQRFSLSINMLLQIG